MRYNEYPREIRDEAIALYRRGKRTSEISDALGVPGRTVRDWASEAGFTRIKRVFPRNADRDVIVARFLSEKRSPQWLSDVHGYSLATIYRWLADAGHPQAGSRHRLNPKRAAALYRKFGTYTAVAEVLGCNPSWARKLVRRTA